MYINLDIALNQLLSALGIKRTSTEHSIASSLAEAPTIIMTFLSIIVLAASASAVAINAQDGSSEWQGWPYTSNCVASTVYSTEYSTIYSTKTQTQVQTQAQVNTVTALETKTQTQVNTVTQTAPAVTKTQVNVITSTAPAVTSYVVR